MVKISKTIKIIIPLSIPIKKYVIYLCEFIIVRDVINDYIVSYAYYVGMTFSMNNYRNCY